MTRSHTASFLILGLLAALGMFLILYATPQGLGLSDDSIAYIAGARSLLSGAGYREAWLASNGAVTHFPPAFSSTLALIGLSGMDPLRVSRFLNSLLFGANIFLLGLIGWRMTRSQVAGIVLALLFVVNASMLRVHAVAMSEPLYIFFSLAAFLAFNAGVSGSIPLWTRELPASKILLILTGVLTALAYLTRYAGLALLATFIVAIILLGQTWRRRFVEVGYFLIGFIPFAAAWSIRNKLVADNATNRTLVYHPLSTENIRTGIYNFSEFLIPVETWRRALVKMPDLFLTLVIVIAVVILIWLANKGLRKFFQPETVMPETLSFVNGLYIFGYFASILSSMMLFDASTKFKLRINAPIYVSLLILLVWLGFWLWGKRNVWLQGLVAGCTIFLVLLSMVETGSVLAQLHKGGQGYASFQWYDSEAMDFIGELPESTRIFTNQPGPVYLYTGRPSYVLPDLIDPVTGLPREGFEEGAKVLQAEVLSGRAVLVLFKFGSEAEDVQSTYLQLANDLYLAHTSRGDKIYTAFPSEE